MQKITQKEYHRTSISLTPDCKRRLKAAVIILKRNGWKYSESKLLRQLAMQYLQHWRGTGLKSATARRYNEKIKGIRYVQVPWYIDKVLYTVLWERGVHSGMAISRMLEFALRHFMPRLMESILRHPVKSHPFGKRNAPYWQKRYDQRKRHNPKIVIIYSAKTENNNSKNLSFRQLYRIFPFDFLLQGKLPPNWAILF